LSNADDRNPSPGRRTAIAGGLIAAAAVLIPITGAVQPAQASTTTSISVAGVTPRVTGAGTILRTPALKRPEGDDDPSLTEDQRQLGEAAVAMARTKIGSPYVWGADGPDSFDCSGLMQWAYKKVGVSLPRVTYDQYGDAEQKVSWKNLSVGDLIFFNSLNHVGIISKRKAKQLWMIHAPSTGSNVKEVKLDGYRRQTFAGAIRPS
jgi:cell wall-associated NlpC family hydrolase